MKCHNAALVGEYGASDNRFDWLVLRLSDGTPAYLIHLPFSLEGSPLRTYRTISEQEVTHRGSAQACLALLPGRPLFFQILLPSLTLLCRHPGSISHPLHIDRLGRLVIALALPVQIIRIPTIMGVFDAIRGRDEDGKFTRAVVDTPNISNNSPMTDGRLMEDPEAKQTQMAISAAKSTLPVSLDDKSKIPAARDEDSTFGINGVDDDEKEAEHNPDRVTSQAALGQQKAEAAALVWSRPAVFMIYAW